MDIKFLDRNDFEEFIPQLVDLFQVCYNKKVHKYYSVPALRWRHLENPFREILNCVIFDKRKIVASYSGSSCLMTIDKKEVRAFMGLNAATHPDYNERGYFYALSKALTDYAKRKGYKVIISFPNYNSHRIVVDRLERKDVYEIPTMVLDLTAPIAFTPQSVTSDNEFVLDYERFTLPAALNSVQKSGAYLKWRYADNPVDQYSNFVMHRDKEVTSFMVVKKYMDRLNIIDFQASDPQEGNILLQQALNYAQSLGLASISTWAPRHTFFHRLCEKLGLRNSMPVTYFVIKDLTDGELKISTNYSDWYIQQGDFNAY